MSQENVEVVRRAYAAMNSRDYSILPELAHPDIVVDVSRNVFNPGVHHGTDGIMRFVEQIDETWETFEFEPEELIDTGDQVVAAVRIPGTGRGSGVTVDMRVFNVWTLIEGKVVRLEGGHRERAQALEAAGLSE